MIGGPELHLIKLAPKSDQVLSGLLQEIKVAWLGFLEDTI